MLRPLLGVFGRPVWVRGAQLLTPASQLPASLCLPHLGVGVSRCPTVQSARSLSRAAVAAMAPTLEAELAGMAGRVVKHMNEDHGDSCLAWAHHYAKMPAATSAKMTGVTPSGFTLDVTLPDGLVKSATIPYSPPLTEAKQVRKVAVAMHFEAFNALGMWYKLKMGFFSGAAKQAWTHLPPRLRMAVRASAAVLVAAIVYVVPWRS